MDIGIFGHSIALWDKDKDPSWHFITRLQNHLSANMVNSGSNMCSEERILFQLKKLKKLDLAIIFHADPMNCFVPSWHRDLHTLGKTELERKFNLIKGSSVNEIMQNTYLNGFFTTWAKMAELPEDEQTLLSLINKIENLDNPLVAATLRELASTNNLKLGVEAKYDTTENLIKLLQPYIDDNKFYKELIDALTLHKKYLYHPDLQQNRYYGALIQIDQYLSYKQIPVVHCLGKDYWYPSWFKFTSGVIDKELDTFQTETSPERSLEFPAGHDIVFEKLLDLISAARSKEVIH
jgi:hypothetical protein